MKVEKLAAAGSVVSGLLASACCLGPFVLALLGVSGASATQAFEPLRPYLLVVTYGLLGTAVHFAWHRPACAPGQACALPRHSRRAKAVVGLAALLVVAATTFPWYAAHLPF
jgi:mercuric ion transport protein